MSNGAAETRFAVSRTSAAATKRNTASGIDKAADEPRTSDAIDLRAFARHPHRAPSLFRCGIGSCAGEGLTGVPPSLEAASEIYSLDVPVAKPRGSALTETVTLAADADDDCLPLRSLLHAATSRTGSTAEEPGMRSRVSGESRLSAQVSDYRAAGTSVPALRRKWM